MKKSQIDSLCQTTEFKRSNGAEKCNVIKIAREKVLEGSRWATWELAPEFQMVVLVKHKL